LLLKYSDFISQCLPNHTIQEPSNTSRVQMVVGTRVRRVPKGLRSVSLRFTYNQHQIILFWSLYMSLSRGSDPFEIELNVYGYKGLYEVKMNKVPAVRELGGGLYSVSVSLDIIEDKSSGSVQKCPLVPTDSLSPQDDIYPC